MKIYFTRDSVSAGDDGDAPHAMEWAVPDGLSTNEVALQVIGAARLPSISGGLATWSLCSIKPLAVTAEQWTEAKLINPIPPRFSELDVQNGVLRLHFSYHAQQEPGLVYEVLRRLRTRAE